jgi:hypothetical protein
MITAHAPFLCFFLFIGLAASQQMQVAQAYISSDDITSHPTYASSLEKFVQVEKEMFRIKERASFHQFVHIIPTVLKLINAERVLEIGII